MQFLSTFYFQDEYHRHWATSIGETLAFHMKAFANPKLNNVPDEWSHANAYSRFEAWGCQVEAPGTEPGLTCLTDVIQGGLRITTRRWAPDGPPVSGRTLGITTAPVYRAGAEYLIQDLSLQTGTVSATKAMADAEGRIAFSVDGSGHQISFVGPVTGAQPPVLLPTTDKDVLRVPPAQEVRLVPTPTSMPTPTATQSEAELRVTAELVNCRFGPGTVYELINELSQGQSARVVGRDVSSTWWYIHDPGNPDGFCWVSASVTDVNGEVEKLPVVSAPLPKVTKATLRAEPDRIVVGGSQFPQTIFLEAEVTTNGHTFVTWKRDASTGVSSDNVIMVFEQAGTQLINDYYQIGAPNEYWIKLQNP